MNFSKSGLDLPCFGMANESMRLAWRNQCATAVASGAIDGCFVDRAAQYQYGCNSKRKTNGGKPLISIDACSGYATAQAELQSDLGSERVVLSNCGGQADATRCPPPGVAGVFFEFWCDRADGTAKNWPGMGPPNSTCADLVREAARLGEAGKIVQVHRGVGAENNATYGLAAFLLAAGNKSFYGDGAWSGEWTWLPEYDRAPGAPLGPYAADAGDALLLRRSFARLDVVVDTRASTAWLTWRGND